MTTDRCLPSPLVGQQSGSAVGGGAARQAQAELARLVGPRRLMPGSWANRAACRGSGLDFSYDARYGRPQQKHRTKAKAAKALCRSCPVRSECLEWALQKPDPAFRMIAGGMDMAERRVERRRRAAMAQPGGTE